MVPVPEQAFGNFFEGDCYIILNVSHFNLIHRETLQAVSNSAFEMFTIQEHFRISHRTLSKEAVIVELHGDFSWLIKNVFILKMVLI